ncbi:DUF4349 domain-containing protein [Ilyomonas limi]|uniref:DUF4349 domain-containing protein n=1 Tax=Ilyomonas limi TaxID=2575867 RepID=A0A4U3KXL5_9BACT|nr:DUF4349 domain-containing protein [Ilyomonas limi]TKK67190.1 DUF4349 domain-containing protein [Ilyomonas limi]
MKLPFYSVAVIAMCLLVACSSNSNKLNETADSAEGASIQDVTLAAPAPPPTAGEEEKANNFSGEFSVVSADTINQRSSVANPDILHAGNPTTEDWDKKIIKTARLTLELKNYTTFNTAIHDKLKRYGAYIAGEQQTESDARIENILTIKVPVVLFESLMNSIGGDGIKVLEKNISTEDVTGEVVDIKARIEAKQQVRDRYLELLKQSKSMKDILAVQEEINGIQEDLEAASGRASYLSHSAAYSTINLTYYQYLNGNSADTAEPSFITKVEAAFATGGTIITNIILFFISVWPLVLAGGILLLYVKKWKLKKA